MEILLFSTEVLATETRIFAFSELLSMEHALDLALIQQDVKACNFWEFLEIGLLPVSSYSYTQRRYTCLGSLWSSTLWQPAPELGCSFMLGRKRRDQVNLKLRGAPKCSQSPLTDKHCVLLKGGKMC